MNPAVTEIAFPSDPFPKNIDVQRARRRSVELSLCDGTLRARVPMRIPRAELQTMLAGLRRELWDSYRATHCFGGDGLSRCAERARKRWLADIDLPEYTIRFAGRMQKRWASCSTPISAAEAGSIRVSRSLEGHPNWLLEHLLLHELIHLIHPNHGAAFKALLARSSSDERAAGYLEALSGESEWGRGRLRGRGDGGPTVKTDWNEEEGQPPLPLFDS